MNRPALTRSILLALLCAAAAGGAVRANDCYLLPAEARPQVGATFDLGMYISDVFPGALTEWRTDQVRQFILVDAAGHTDLKEAPVGGIPRRAHLNLRRPGASVFALATAPSYATLPAKEFQQYLKEEEHDDILEMRDKMKASKSTGRERFSRYVKAIVVAAGPAPAPATAGASTAKGSAAAASLPRGGDADPATAVVGLTLEIVPEVAPASLGPGGKLPVRVLFEGAPDAGARLCAAWSAGAAGGEESRKHGHYAWCGALDAAGRAEVPIDKAGWYLLRTTRMRALGGDNRADWASYWGALTFQIPGETR